MTLIHIGVFFAVIMLLGLFIRLCVDFFEVNSSVANVLSFALLGIACILLFFYISDADKQEKKEQKQSISKIEKKLLSGYSLNFKNNLIVSEGAKKDILEEYEKSSSDYYIDYDSKNKIVKIIKK